MYAEAVCSLNVQYMNKAPELLYLHDGASTQQTEL